jgi:hypothetical protein
VGVSAIESTGLCAQAEEVEQNKLAQSVEKKAGYPQGITALHS